MDKKIVLTEEQKLKIFKHFIQFRFPIFQKDFEEIEKILNEDIYEDDLMEGGTGGYRE